MLGNMNAVVSGDTSPILVARLAKDLKDQWQDGFLEDFPWLAESDSWVVDLLWEKIAQYRLARRHCARMGGDYKKDGSVRPAAARADKMWESLVRLLDRLGGSPASRFSMGLKAMEAEDIAARAARLRNGHDL